MPKTLNDTTRLCVHTITTRAWSVEEAIEGYQMQGVAGITIWREALEGRNPIEVGGRIRAAGLRPVSLCRGGFFPSTQKERRQEAIQDNLHAIDQAVQLGAPLLVLVCGADPQQPLEESRRQIQQGIEALLPHAEACGVRLGIEPLHPMYACDRSAINTLRQANDLCEEIGSRNVGVVVDVYHLWWDPDLRAEIQRAGDSERLLAFHICDWKIPTTDLLNDRGLMGEGCIPLRTIRGWMEQAGFDGFIEVEIFSKRYWRQQPASFLKKIRSAYLKHV